MLTKGNLKNLCFHNSFTAKIYILVECVLTHLSNFFYIYIYIYILKLKIRTNLAHRFFSATTNIRLHFLILFIIFFQIHVPNNNGIIDNQQKSVLIESKGKHNLSNIEISDKIIPCGLRLILLVPPFSLAVLKL